MPIKVLIADDHFPVRFGLELLTREVLGSNTKIEFANDFHLILEKIKKESYDLLITDIIMPGMDCLTMMEKAFKILPNLRILVVSVQPKEVFAARYMSAGAYGYVCKTDSDNELRNAIYQINLGKRYYPPGIIEKKFTAQQFERNNLFERLSQREFSVMTLLLKGNGMIEIANALSLSPSTASTYRSRIFNKLQIKSLIELYNLAKECKIVID